MKNTVSNKRKTFSFSQAKKVLQEEAVASWLEWTEEVNGDFSSEIEFILGLKGRWLLCHMGKSYPYTIRFRLIWERDYTRSQPQNFIALAKEKLLH